MEKLLAEILADESWDNYIIENLTLEQIEKINEINARKRNK